jgi:hypothetical protein
MGVQIGLSACVHAACVHGFPRKPNQMKSRHVRVLLDLLSISIDQRRSIAVYRTVPTIPQQDPSLPLNLFFI